MATTYRFGSRGDTVKQIQKALYAAGFPCGMMDGIFGISTQEAAIEFQKANGLTADGIVGPATLAKLLPSVAKSALGLKKSNRTIKEIIVHCTATVEGRSYTVDDIRRWHKAQGWSDIGYHYVLYLDGTVHYGRNVNISGAHCTNHNAHSIGVAYVGGVSKDGKTPKDTRTEQQKTALLSLLIDLKRQYPNAEIHGHRDFANKACPSFDATKEYRRL